MKTLRSRIAFIACAALLAACAGGSHSSSPMLPTTPLKSAKVNVAFVINAPQPSTSQSTSSSRAAHSAATGVKPQYLSPATQSITLDITGPTTIDETQNLTVNSSGCTSSLASTICTLTVALDPCTSPSTDCYTASLTTYDQTGGTGNVLSAAQSIIFTVTAGQSNSVDLALSGVPAITIVAPTDSTTTGNSSGGYDLSTIGTHTFIAESLDADGNIVVGSGAPLFNISAASGTLSGVTTAPSTTTASAPDSFTVTPPTTFTSGSASFTVTPTFTGQATDGCIQGGANCAPVTVTVDMFGTETFTYTGAAQSFTVPAGATQVTVTALGAEGDKHDCGGGTAGLGASVTATIPVVTPGETLAVYVGGWGDAGFGFNGGGDSTAAGGGASDVREGGTTLADRVIVAGGGGSTGCLAGGNGSTGGNGGAPGATAASGADSPDGGGGGGGGTQSAGGAGGTGVADGADGSLGDGGAGVGSGNGGGGYYGGGGGGTGMDDETGGGGGGSSFVEATATNVSGTAGGNPNDYGEVIISW